MMGRMYRVVFRIDEVFGVRTVYDDALGDQFVK
jgi:hypothetical protein